MGSDVVIVGAYYKKSGISNRVGIGGRVGIGVSLGKNIFGLSIIYSRGVGE